MMGVKSFSQSNHLGGINIVDASECLIKDRHPCRALSELEPASAPSIVHQTEAPQECQFSAGEKCVVLAENVREQCAAGATRSTDVENANRR
jgi:hypothetical protein